MDFDKLLEPYNENGRTLKGQIKWLLRQGFPQTSIDHAIATVYKRLQNGETFPNGHELDQALRDTAREHFDNSIDQGTRRRITGAGELTEEEWSLLPKRKKIWEVIRGRA